jgi:hypothetical protein
MTLPMSTGAQRSAAGSALLLAACLPGARLPSPNQQQREPIVVSVSLNLIV